MMRRNILEFYVHRWPVRLLFYSAVDLRGTHRPLKAVSWLAQPGTQANRLHVGHTASLRVQNEFGISLPAAGVKSVATISLLAVIEAFFQQTSHAYPVVVQLVLSVVSLRGIWGRPLMKQLDTGPGFKRRQLKSI